MENTLFANAKKLYDHQLYECVIPVASLLGTLLQNDRNVAPWNLEYQAKLYLAHSYYKERHFHTASGHLKDLLQQRRIMSRYKNACLVAIESSYSQFTDAELRRSLAKCYMEMGEPEQAIATLNVVPVKMRTPRINLMLARLLHRTRATSSGSPSGPNTRHKRDAQMAYTHVLRECPMAMPAIEALLELGVNGSDVNSMVIHGALVPAWMNNTEWLESWIKALAQMYDCNHLEAARTLQRLNDSTSLRRNEHLLLAIGKCYYYHGNVGHAEKYLWTAVRASSYNLEAVGLLCAVLEMGKISEASERERERMFAQVTSQKVREFSPWHWFVYAQHAFAGGKHARSLQFVERCLGLEPHHVEGLLLRGNLLYVLKRPEDALLAFRSAQLVAPNRFEVYKGLVHCYLMTRRVSEAKNMCAWTIRNFRTSPRSYTILGQILFNFSKILMKDCARCIAEKSLDIDPNYTPGAALLAEIYQYEGSIKKAVQLLEKHLEQAPRASLFTQLGDIMRMEKQPMKALEYYYRALA
ncbi:hypothetical protein KR018_011949 [Drosophila ironensis]|nr:hypothetical protein KR018_011949 [Drosophila ironensis]